MSDLQGAPNYPENEEREEGSSPIQPYEYQGKQVVINSDRLLFNAKNDSILIFSNKHIAFSANNNIHFDTGDEGHFALNSKNIYLGLEADKNLPPEPAVLGDQLERILNDMCDMLEGTISALEWQYPTHCLASAPGAPCVPNPADEPFVTPKQQIKNIRNNIPLFKSERVKLPTDNMYGSNK